MRQGAQLLFIMNHRDNMTARDTQMRDPEAMRHSGEMLISISRSRCVVDGDRMIDNDGWIRRREGYWDWHKIWRYAGAAGSITFVIHRLFRLLSSLATK